MALTVTIRKRDAVGQSRVTIVDIVPDSSWLVTGESLTAANVGLKTIDHCDIEQVGGYVFRYDRTNSLLLAYNGGGQAAHTHDLTFIGGITATEAVAIQGGDTLGKNAATNRTIVGADSATKGGVVASTASVAAASAVDGADLSSLTIRARFVGR